MSIAVKHLTKRYGELVVFENLSIEFAAGRITAILGPSGSGKTTLLNILSKLVERDDGELQGIEGKSVSYLFQEPRLLPWKTVRGNFDFVLSSVYPDKEERCKVIDKHLQLVNLLDYADYHPRQLSGGMKQRVAIARAFAYPSDILLMDEPFKALDLHLKISLMDEFVDLWQQDKRTVICVTHDLDEALYLADRIIIFSERPARVVQDIAVDELRQQRRHNDNQLLSVRDRIYHHLTRRDGSPISG